MHHSHRPRQCYSGNQFPVRRHAIATPLRIMYSESRTAPTIADGIRLRSLDVEVDIRRFVSVFALTEALGSGLADNVIIRQYAFTQMEDGCSGPSGRSCNQ